MSKLPHLCRDCLDEFEHESPLARCPGCASSRVIHHPELHDLWMAHMDCDAFFASIEKRDDPSLADKPVIIGGGKRGVVATCCYIARMSGVHSAMPMFTARKKCPEAVIIAPRMQKYSEASKKIRSLMNELTPLVEPLSIDEAFLDLAGTGRLHKGSAARTLAGLARKIEREVGVSVSIGLSYNKFLAKIASDRDKPRGMALIGRKEAMEFLADKPISIIHGVGKVFTRKLEDDGFHTIRQLQGQDKNSLIRRYGEMGARLFHLCRGEDNRTITTVQKVKSISNETTFEKDISELDPLSSHLLHLCEKVSRRMKEQGLVGHTITLKLKSCDFKSITRARHLSLPTQLAHVIYETACPMLEREARGARFRLIGIGVSSLEKSMIRDEDNKNFHGHIIPDPGDLLEPAIARKAAAERAMDRVRNKFGNQALVRGKLYRQNIAREKQPDHKRSPHRRAKN